MRKKWVLLLISLLFLFPLQLFAIKPITIILDWYPNPDHAALLYADAAGYFDKAGLKVHLISPTDPAIGIKMVAAHKADLAVTYQPSFVLANQQGLNLKWIATLVSQPLDSMVVVDSSPIKQISDLKGKTIGFSTPGVDQLMVALMLKHANLSLSDVNMVNMPDGLASALMNGKINVMQGAMRNVEPYIFAAQGVSVRQFFPEDYGFPMYDELILVTSSQEANNPAFKTLVTALAQASRALKADPTAAWYIVIKKYPTMNTEINQKSWLVTVPLLASNPAYYNAKRYQTFEAFITANSNKSYFY